MKTESLAPWELVVVARIAIDLARKDGPNTPVVFTYLGREFVARLCESEDRATYSMDIREGNTGNLVVNKLPVPPCLLADEI